MIKIKNWKTSEVICEISEIKDIVNYKSGLSYADLSYADLSDVDLNCANLSRANFTGTDLRSADLSDADLRGANLIGANLMNADLRDANLGRANLMNADLRSAFIDYQIEIGLINKVAQHALANENALKMEDWHTCESTHCIAGWAVHLAENGKDLEKLYRTQVAGLLLLGPEAHSHFYDSKEDAREYLKQFLN